MGGLEDAWSFISELPSKDKFQTDLKLVYSSLLLVLVLLIIVAETFDQEGELIIKQQDSIPIESANETTIIPKKVMIKLPNTETRGENKSCNSGTEVKSVDVECTFEVAEDGDNALYNIRVILNNNHSYLVRKKHNEFGKLYKSLKRTHPEISKLKSLISSTGMICKATPPSSNIDITSSSSSFDTQVSSTYLVVKDLKFAKFDLFLQALVELDQPWPFALSAFLSDDVNNHLLDQNDHPLAISSSSSSECHYPKRPKHQPQSSETISNSSSLQPSTSFSTQRSTLTGVGGSQHGMDLVLTELTENENMVLKSIIQKVNVSNIRQHLWPGDSVEKYCLRILKARRFHLENAIKHIEEDLTWRNENNFKSQILLSNIQSPLTVVLKLSYDDMSKYLPIWHQGYDKLNRPFSIQQMGRVRLPILLSKTSLDSILNFQAYHTEYMVKLCNEKKNIENFVVIIDAEDWDAKNIFYSNAFKWVKKMNVINGHHNPDRLGQMLIINAPSMVHSFYNMVSYLLDEVTARKIQIFSTKDQWAPVLQSLIDLHQLPPEYGGTGVNNLSREYPTVATMDEQGP